MLLYYLDTLILFIDNWLSFYNFLAYFSTQDRVNGSSVLISLCIFQHTHPVKDTLSYQTLNILVFPFVISREMKLCHHPIYSVYCIQWNETSSHVAACSIQWKEAVLLHYLACFSIQHPISWNLVTFTSQCRIASALKLWSRHYPICVFQYTLSSKIYLRHPHYPAN